MKLLFLKKLFPLLATGAITALLALGSSGSPASAENSETPTIVFETEVEETSPILPNGDGPDFPDLPD